MPKICKITACISLLFFLFSQNSIPSFAQQNATSNTSVSLTVQLRDVDIPITLARTTDNETANEDTVISYQITYGSLLSFAVPLTIYASWDDANMNGSLVTLLDYVNGSGTNAYNGSPAIIDTVHKLVYWNIQSIPGGTVNQIVSFKLRTNSTNTGSSPVSFMVHAGADSSGAKITPIQLLQKYLHSQLPSDSPVSTPKSEPARVTPTPTRVVSRPLFSSIDVQTISSNSATARFSLTSPAKLTIRYGTSPNNLGKSLRVLDPVTSYELQFPDLLPNTPYYFTIRADTDISSSTSDIYTFTTAKDKSTSFLDLSSLILSFDNLILSAAQFNQGFTQKTHLPAAVITTNTPFEFHFAISDSSKVRKIIVLMKDANVLGINSFIKNLASDSSTYSAEIVEISKGIFSGRLRTNSSPGKYTILARITDENNNITEQSIATVIVVKPLTVLESGSHRPLENVRVLFYRKQSQTNDYSIVSEQSITLKNPLYTESNGTIPTNLTPGDYKIHISATGYTPQDSYFTISATNDNQYPTVYLTKSGFSLLNTATYYTEVASDFLSSFTAYLATIGISNRLFNLISLIALCFFIIVTILSFCVRFHIPVSALPAYFFSYYHLHHHKSTARIISGTVIDEKSGGFPVSNAIIYLLDAKRRRILLHAQTNTLGQFTLTLPPASAYLLVIKKRHYISTEYSVHSSEEIVISLPKDPLQQNRIIGALRFVLLNLVGLFFELLLCLSFILEVIFSLSLGVAITTPYLILTFTTLVLWLLYVKNKRSIYSV